METKIIAWITFDLLGVGYILGNILVKFNSVIDSIILFVLAIYFVIRSYIRLKRDAILLRKETFEQEQRELMAKTK